MSDAQTSDRTTDDVLAIIQGMNRAPASDQTRAPVPSPLPSSLQPDYQPLLPAALQPRQASILPVLQSPSGPQQSSAPWAANQPNYTVGPAQPGDPGYQPSPAGRPVPAGQQHVALGTPYQVVPPVQPVTPPPRTGERPPLNNMPQLWNGDQRGPSGQTKQQFLFGRMMHESQGDPTILNYVARNDPRMYDRGYTAGGLLQDLNTTWKRGVEWAMADPQRYPMSADPRTFATARQAPWDVQWQVNSAIYDHAGEQPWRGQGSGLGGNAGYKAIADLNGVRDQLDGRTSYQGLTPAQPRSFGEWGRDPPGMGGEQPGEMPRQSDFGRIMSNLAPLLVGIGSLALRLPLSTAITAYGAMARAQQNGQELDYQRNRTRWQDQLKEATAQQTLESQAAGDAFSEYGNNNPQGLQQRLAEIALQYNDPTMYRMAEQGDLNGIHQLQQRRDMANQNLVKLNRAQQDEREQQEVEADVAARDKQWAAAHPNATPEEAAIAHAQHRGEAEQDVGGRGKTGSGAATQGYQLFNVLGADGKPTGQQVREGRNGGWVDANTGQPVTLKNGEKAEPVGRPGQQKPTPTNPYVAPDQQRPDDVTAQPDQQQQQDQDQPDQQQDQPDQQQQQQGQPDQGAAPQAPAGPTQTAAAPAPAEQPAPYQVAQAGSGIPPPLSSKPAQAAPGMGPNMSRLNEDGRRLARDYATNGNEALQDVDKAFRAPLIAAGQELRSEMQDAAQSGLTGNDLDKRLHQIDPTYADYLKGVSTYNNDLPTPGRGGVSSGRIMALSIAGKLNPNFSEQNLRAQQDFRRPGGYTQRTLSRVAIMAESGKQVREYLKALPADPGLQRWQRAWDQFVNNKLVGDHRYSDLFVALRQYIQEANVVTRGGQESVTETGEQLGTRGEGGLFGGAPFAISGTATPGMILGLLKTDARNVMARMNNYRNQWRQQDGHGEMPGDDSGAYKTFEGFSQMDVDKEAGIPSDSDIEKFLKQ